LPRSALAAAFVLVIVLVALASPTHADELLTNSGFEQGVTGWGASHSQLESVSSPVYEGKSAARLSTHGTQTQEAYQRVGVVPGSVYRFVGRIFMNDPSIRYAYLRVTWLDSSGNHVSDAEDSPWITIPQPEYVLASTNDAVSPLAAASARLSIRIESNLGASGPINAYFDDLSFTGAIPPPSTPSPTPSATPAPTPALTATPSPATGTPPPTPRPSATATPDEEPDIFDTLTNGGFETMRTDGSPYAWKDIGADLTTITAPVAEGSRALAVTSRSASTKWAYQTVRVQPGEFYDAAGYTWSSDASETFLRVSWYATPDGSGAAIDSVDSTAASQGESRYEALASGPVQAPGAARTAKLRLMLRPGSDAEITAFFDAVSFGRTNARPPAGAPASSGSQVSGGGGARAGSGADVEPDDLSEAIVERYPLGFANVRPAAPAPPAAVSGPHAGYDWLAVLGLLAGGGVIALAAFLEWSHRRIVAGEDSP